MPFISTESSTENNRRCHYLIVKYSESTFWFFIDNSMNGLQNVFILLILYLQLNAWHFSFILLIPFAFFPAYYNALFFFPAFDTLWIYIAQYAPNVFLLSIILILYSSWDILHLILSLLDSFLIKAFSHNLNIHIKNTPEICINIQYDITCIT